MRGVYQHFAAYIPRELQLLVREMRKYCWHDDDAEKIRVLSKQSLCISEYRAQANFRKGSFTEPFATDLLFTLVNGPSRSFPTYVNINSEVDVTSRREGNTHRLSGEFCELSKTRRNYVTPDREPVHIGTDVPAWITILTSSAFNIRGGDATWNSTASSRTRTYVVAALPEIRTP